MKGSLLLPGFLFLMLPIYAQTIASESYPKITGYGSIVHPIVSVKESGATFNFTSNYVVGFPFGINIIKSDRIGFSFEVAAVIKVEDKVDNVSHFLFHPGVMFRFSHGFTIITR